MKILTKERVEYIENNFFEKGHGGYDIEAFKTLTCPEELHQLATNYNWDDGAQVMEWVIDSPLCDKGTALLIYWQLDVGYYQKYSNQDEANKIRRGEVLVNHNYKLLRSIQEKYLMDHFLLEKIRFDPCNYRGSDLIEERGPDEEDPIKWQIPDVMKEATEGEDFPDYWEMYYGYH